jgi:hypothetical protein
MLAVLHEAILQRGHHGEREVLPPVRAHDLNADG